MEQTDKTKKLACNYKITVKYHSSTLQLMKMMKNLLFYLLNTKQQADR